VSSAFVLWFVWLIASRASILAVASPHDDESALLLAKTNQTFLLAYSVDGHQDNLEGTIEGVFRFLRVATGNTRALHLLAGRKFCEHVNQHQKSRLFSLNIGAQPYIHVFNFDVFFELSSSTNLWRLHLTCDTEISFLIRKSPFIVTVKFHFWLWNYNCDTGVSLVILNFTCETEISFVTLLKTLKPHVWNSLWTWIFTCDSEISLVTLKRNL
jgi:hypothetical protein